MRRWNHPAQIRASRLSSTALSKASVFSSDGSRMNSGMPLICTPRPAPIARNWSSKHAIDSLRENCSAFQYLPEKLPTKARGRCHSAMPRGPPWGIELSQGGVRISRRRFSASVTSTEQPRRSARSCRKLIKPGRGCPLGRSTRRSRSLAGCSWPLKIEP